MAIDDTFKEKARVHQLAFAVRDGHLIQHGFELPRRKREPVHVIFGLLYGVYLKLVEEIIVDCSGRNRRVSSAGRVFGYEGPT